MLIWGAEDAIIQIPVIQPRVIHPGVAKAHAEGIVVILAQDLIRRAGQHLCDSVAVLVAGTETGAAEVVLDRVL